MSHAAAQRRNALPRFDGFRCAAAPLREKSSILWQIPRENPSLLNI
jgi:hypothetical protein